MPQQILSDDTGRVHLPAVNSSAILVVVVLWLAFACGLPLYQLREARQQAHQDLLHVLATDRSDDGGIIAAFDRSNQNLDAAVSGSCLLLAFTSILLVNQLLRLKRRCDALAHELSFAERPPHHAD